MPANGAVLNTAPATVTLTFLAKPGMAATAVTIAGGGWLAGSGRTG